MSDVIISQRWLARGGTSADLATVNETPKARELILETDTGRLKRGDGATAYNDLPYINTGKIDFSGIADGKVPMWSASNSRFEIKSITADGVEYTAGSSSSLAADNVAEALDELSAKVDEKIGDAPSNSNTYGRKGGVWVIIGGSGGDGAMQFVGSALVEGSAASDLTVSDLDLESDGQYVIQFSIGNATASAAVLSLFYNGDTTAGNYYRQHVSGNNTSVIGSRGNDAQIGSLTASAAAVGEAKIMRDANGMPRARSHTSVGAPSGIILQDFIHVRNDNANVTSITLSSSVASSLVVGSYIKIWKLVG